jgi:lysophospholipase L1-like esterase
MKRKLIYGSLAGVVLLIVGEVILRLLGFGNPPLYVASDQYEYIYAPNQDLKRYGNRILTNEYSMRSEPLGQNDKVKVLLFGDSIIHGGAKTGHEELASTLLELKLQEEYGDETRVLNVSCGSWGPDNTYGYLQEQGDFAAERFIMVFSSHDYKDQMNFRPIVGNLKSYPAEKPVFAIGEVLNRFVIPRITGNWMKDPNARPKIHQDQLDGMNPGWENFRSYCETHEIPLTVILHPTTKELEKGEYNQRGKALIAWFEENEVDYVNEMASGTQPQYYRDEIHYNAEGQRFLYVLLYAEVTGKNLAQ